VDAFDGQNVRVADSAADLHGIVNDLLAGLGDEFLGFRHHAPDAVHVDAAVHRARRYVGHRTGGIQKHDRLGHLKTDALELGDDLAEGFSPGGVVCGHFQGGARRADGHGRRAEPLRNHHGVEDVIGAVDLADDIGFRHFGVLEDQTRRSSAPAAHQAVKVFRFHARTAVHDKRGNRFLRLGFGVEVRLGVKQKEIRSLAADDKALLPVDEEVISHVFGFGGCSEKVGAAPGFRQALRGKKIAPQERFDIFLLLFIRAVKDNRIADQLRPHAEDAGHFVAESSDFLHEHAGGDPVHLPAAPFFRITASQQIPFSGFAQEFLGKLDVIRVHVENRLTGDRFDEFPRLVADFELFFGQKIIKHNRWFLSIRDFY